MSAMATAYIGLGANLGDRAGTLREAVRRLGDLGQATRVSSLYETAPVGFVEQPAFLNAVVELQTDLDTAELIAALLGIEASQGRTRSFRNAPRTLDLDLLLLDDVVLSSEGVQVPHPRLHERLFVLTPLAEIVPDLIHPVFHQSVKQLKGALVAQDDVERVAGPGWVSPRAGGAETGRGHSGNRASG